MNTVDTILPTGKATPNEVYLARKVDELTEELARLKPTRFKVIEPFYRPPKTS